jgi:hypothetical protein
LTSFAGVLGFEVSRYFAINDRACLTKLFFARTGIKPASCKAFSFRNRSQMGSIGRVQKAEDGKQMAQGSHVFLFSPSALEPLALEPFL